MLPITIILALVAAKPATVIEPKGFDSPSIAAAISQAQAGDTVRLPEGTFSLAEPMRPKSGIKLLGAGQEKTRLVYRGTKPAVLIGLNGCQDVEIAHMTLDGRNNPLVQQGITRRRFAAAVAPSPDHPQPQGQDLGPARHPLLGPQSDAWKAA